MIIIMLVIAQVMTVGEARVGQVNGLGPYEAETLSYGASITNNGGTIGPIQMLYVDRFVKSAKSNGYWGFLTDCSPMAGNQTNAAVVKLINHTQSQQALLQVFGASATNYSPAVGWILNGDKYIWPGLVMSNNIFGGSNEMVAVWAGGQVTNTRSWLYGTDNTGTHNYNYALSGYLAASFGWQWQNVIGGNSASVGLANSDYFAFDSGFILANRTETNSAHLWINGYPMATNTTAITLAADSTLVWPLGARYVGSPPIGSPGSLSGNWILSFYAVGRGFPDALQDEFHADVLTLQRGLGRVPSPARRPGVIIIGQSNSYGAGGGNPSQAWSHYGNLVGGASAQFTAGNGSTNYPSTRIRAVDTHSVSGWVAFSDELSYLTRTYGNGSTTNDCIYESFGINGAGYGALAKGTKPFIDSTNWANVQSGLEASLSGQPLWYPAVMAVHGESDSGAANYDSIMRTWQGDYQAALNSLHGDTRTIPMLHSQIDSYTASTIGLEHVNDGLLANHEASNGATNVLVCPKYQFAYSDTIHVGPVGLSRMGEQYAWAVWKLLSAGKFDPVRPILVAQTSPTQITCTFTGVVNQLVLDTSSFAWLTQPNYGFSYTDSSSPPAITSVALQSSNQVVVTLASDITGKSGRLLSYAKNATTPTIACGTSAADGGNLRDSNPEIGFTSRSNLWNWCVHFTKAVQ